MNCEGHFAESTSRVMTFRLVIGLPADQWMDTDWFNKNKAWLSTTEWK